ncbi:hypothetical protein [Bacillus smithii]
MIIWEKQRPEMPANAQRNNQAKQKNGYPKITNYAQMEAEIIREKKRD